MRFVIIIVICTLIGIALVLAFEPMRADYHRAKQEEIKLKKSLTRLRDENEELKKEIYRLKHDPLYMEKCLRDSFGLAQSNELIYKFED